MAVRHRRGFGYLRKLPSGRYQASYVGPDQARHSAPATFAAKIDGEGWLASEPPPKQCRPTPSLGSPAAWPRAGCVP
jgi:hypothetical protein